MIIKYFYLCFTAVSARLKHNLRFLFQEMTMYKKKGYEYYYDHSFILSEFSFQPK